MEILQSLPPLVTLVLSLLLVVWLVLFLLVPFMLESIRSWTRKSHAELTEMNRKLDRLTALLDARGERHIHVKDARPEARPAREPRADRARKEPTIGG
jgi:hypothetical protein